MALVTNIRYVFPPNWDGNPPVTGGWKRVTLHLSGRCDDNGINTDETDVVKLDISELRNLNGVAPTRIAIETLEWTIHGFENVLLEFDRAPDSTIAVMSGEGASANIVDESDGTDGTGDLIATTYGAAVGASYSIMVDVRLK